MLNAIERFLQKPVHEWRRSEPADIEGPRARPDHSALGRAIAQKQLQFPPGADFKLQDSFWTRFIQDEPDRQDRCRSVFADRYRFEPPLAYQWIVRRNMIGEQPSTQLSPWYRLPDAEVFSASERWSKGDERNLFVFARRQDNDDLACFLVAEGVVAGVVVIHGWTGSGYDVVAEYATVWDWLKAVIDDVAEVAEAGDGDRLGLCVFHPVLR
jgi:hypothetical protein